MMRGRKENRKLEAGERFGSRVVIEEIATKPSEAKKYRVRCDCGRIDIVYKKRLVNRRADHCPKCSRNLAVHTLGGDVLKFKHKP